MAADIMAKVKELEQAMFRLAQSGWSAQVVFSTSGALSCITGLGLALKHPAFVGLTADKCAELRDFLLRSLGEAEPRLVELIRELYQQAGV